MYASISGRRVALQALEGKNPKHVVHLTLPEVYGALADSALAALPEGQLGEAGDLLTELPRRGVTLPAQDGWVLTLWPTTRPGQDGPLVTSYRVTASRGQ